MAFAKNFKAFVMRGNMVDLAVGVIIGAAFGKVVSSLVADVIMPPIGLLIGGVDFSSLVIGSLKIKIGSFLQTVLDFLIVALAVFTMIRGLTRVMPKSEIVADTKACTECAMVIPVAAKRCGHCCEVQAR